MPDVTLLLPLFGAFALLNVAETMAAGCRGVGRFDAEALASVIGNGIFFVAGLAAVLVWGTPFAVACALLCARSEARRGGKECVSTCGSRGAPVPEKQKIKKKDKW